MIEIDCKRQVEQVENPKYCEYSKSRAKIIQKKNYAKTFDGWLSSCIRLLEKDGKMEVALLLTEVLNKHKELDNLGVVRIDGWKGKSDLRIIKRPEMIEVLKWQKGGKGLEPKEVRTIILKNEINAMINSINTLNSCMKGGTIIEKIDTKDLAREYCKFLKIERNDKGDPLFSNGEFKWDTFFSWRPIHNKHTIILDVLDKEGLIHYVGGKVTVLSKKSLSIDSVLNVH